MTSQDIFTLWNLSNAEAEDGTGTGTRNLEDYFKPRIRKNTLPLKINIYTYLLMQLSGLMVSCYDLSIFRSNPRMLIVVGIFILVFIFSMIFGITLLFKLERLEYDSRDLLSNIKSRIRFYRFNFEVWLWLCSATAVIIPNAIVFIHDSFNGTYIIHNVGRYITISLIIFAGLYLLNKVSVYRAISDLKAYYSDLIEGSTGKTTLREKWFKKYRIVLLLFFLLLFIILMVFVLKGLLAFKNF